MVGDNRNMWTPSQVDRLRAIDAEARAQGKRVDWNNATIGIGHSVASCQSKLAELRSRNQDRAVRITLRALREAIARAPASVKPAPRPVVVQKPAAEISDHARSTSTAKLVMDAELRSRIALQGVTAGLLGDPMPGRSALDRIRAGAAEGSAVDGRLLRYAAAPVTLATEPLRIVLEGADHV